MTIIDISWPITPEMTTYKDKKNIDTKPLATFEKNNAREHLLTASTHIGTHIDAPAHFIQNGSTIDQIDLSKLVGPCRVLDLTHVSEKITKEDLVACNIEKGTTFGEGTTFDEGSRILLKTKNSLLSPTAPFNYDFVYLDHSGAAYLAEQKVLCVGIDYLGIERDQPGHPTHITLMKKGIPIIEGLRLQDVDAGSYTLYCMPLSLPGLEAAPARAILKPSKISY